MCVCVCIYIIMNIYLCVCVYILLWIYIYMCVYIYYCEYIYVCVCIYIFIIVNIYIYLLLWIYICVCVYIYIYIYILFTGMTCWRVMQSGWTLMTLYEEKKVLIPAQKMKRVCACDRGVPRGLFCYKPHLLYSEIWGFSAGVLNWLIRITGRASASWEEEEEEEEEGVGWINERHCWISSWGMYEPMFLGVWRYRTKSQDIATSAVSIFFVN